ncbi:hypothetical protein HPB49_009969 [Dermacentor silvarum]|uniref:Uncharacterized protein n=1 Tax=Dermacentor silvarum TaxID=543639 RepID=A0ACB8DCK4_DERSI|nr:hypothetical protein HPB49_009969 [Dermacentor silvarum]
MIVSLNHLQRYAEEDGSFLDRNVSGVETPESKQQWVVWKYPGSPVTKKIRSVPSVENPQKTGHVRLSDKTPVKIREDSGTDVDVADSYNRNRELREEFPGRHGSRLCFGVVFLEARLRTHGSSVGRNVSVSASCICVAGANHCDGRGMWQQDRLFSERRGPDLRLRMRATDCDSAERHASTTMVVLHRDGWRRSCTSTVGL